MKRAPLFLLVLAGACSKLPEIPRGICGNHVLEAGEECDGEVAPLSCGAPRTAGACRYVCSAEIRCPEGSACGADGICRAGSGAFGPAQALAAIRGETLRILDVDRDGVLDLVATVPDRVRIRYGAPDGSFPAQQTVVSRFPTGRAILEDIDGDGWRDVVYPAANGMAILRGQRRRFGTILSPFETGIDQSLKPQIGTYRPNNLLDTFYLLSGQQLVIGLNPQVTFDLPTGWLSTTLVGRPRVGNLTPVPGGLRQILLIAQGNEAHYYGWDNDDLLAAASLNQERTVRFDGEILETPFIADVDGDGRGDLIAPVRGLDKPVILEVARTSSAVPPSSERPCGLSVRGSAVFEVEVPLAIGNLDGDPWPDFVMPHGAWLTLGQPTICGTPSTMFVSAPPRSAFTLARIADVNGDGLNDLVAVDGHDLAIFTNQNGLAFTRNPVDIPGEITRLEVGDFDGDGLQDVLIATASGGSSKLLVAYGSTDQIGQTIEVVADTPPILALSPGELGGDNSSFDGASDLLLMSAGTSAGGVDISIIRGDGSRQMVSALSLRTADDKSLVPAFAAVSGNFCPSRGHTTLATLGLDDMSGASWLFLGSSFGALTRTGTRTWSAALLSDAHGQGLLEGREFKLSCARWSAVDIDGDGIDELWAEELAQRDDPTCVPGRALLVRYAEGSCAPSLEVLNPSGALEVRFQQVQPLNVFDPPRNWEMGPSELRISAFSEGRPPVARLEIPNPTAAIPAQLGGVQGAVVISSEGITWHPLAGGGFGPTVVLGALPPDEVPLSVALADISRDGVPDLVLLTNLSAWLYPGIERGRP
ncbi:MAG: VCBS repeat-containing protein [Myxococcota bacterium]